MAAIALAMEKAAKNNNMQIVCLNLSLLEQSFEKTKIKIKEVVK